MTRFFEDPTLLLKPSQRTKEPTLDIAISQPQAVVMIADAYGLTRAQAEASIALARGKALRVDDHHDLSVHPLLGWRLKVYDLEMVDDPQESWDALRHAF